MVSFFLKLMFSLKLMFPDTFLRWEEKTSLELMFSITFRLDPDPEYAYFNFQQKSFFSPYL